MDILAATHSHLRFLILALGLVAFALCLVAAVRAKAPTRASSLAYRAFVWTLTLQLLLGLIQLVVKWNEYGGELRHRLEHATIMIIAVGLTHWGLRFVKRTDSFGVRNTVFILAGVIILIVLGILILPNGRHLLGMAG